MTVDHFVVGRRRRGRPPSPERRKYAASLWLSDRELELFKAAAKVNNTTMSKFLRNAAVDASHECMEPLPDEDR
jgi:hypothetical protein